jgi:hypothetical protein
MLNNILPEKRLAIHKDYLDLPINTHPPNIYVTPLCTENKTVLYKVRAHKLHTSSEFFLFNQQTNFLALNPQANYTD